MISLALQNAWLKSPLHNEILVDCPLLLAASAVSTQADFNFKTCRPPKRAEYRVPSNPWQEPPAGWGSQKSCFYRTAGGGDSALRFLAAEKTLTNSGICYG